MTGDMENKSGWQAQSRGPRDGFQFSFRHHVRLFSAAEEGYHFRYVKLPRALAKDAGCFEQCGNMPQHRDQAQTPAHWCCNCVPHKCDPTKALPSFQVREYEEKIDRLERTVDQQRREIDNLKNLVQNLDGTVSAADQRVAGLVSDSEQRHNSTSPDRAGPGPLPGIRVARNRVSG